MQLKVDNDSSIEEVKDELQGIFKKKISKHIKAIDQSFSMDNYNYVTE